LLEKRNGESLIVRNEVNFHGSALRGERVGLTEKKKEEGGEGSPRDNRLGGEVSPL